MKNWDYIVRFEQILKEKYGEHVIRNPKSTLTPEKIEKYNKQFREKIVAAQKNKRKTTDEQISQHCIICNNILHTILDDIYYIKFQCCNHCFVQHIEGREDKWQKQ